MFRRNSLEKRIKKIEDKFLATALEEDCRKRLGLEECPYLCGETRKHALYFRETNGV